LISYTLTKSDGSVFRSKPKVLRDLSSSVDSAFDHLRPELVGQNGRIVLRAEFQSDYVMEFEGTLRDGHSEGRFLTFVTAEGKRFKMLEQEFHADLQHGRSIGYYPDGTVMHEGTWSLGLRQGQWTFNTQKLRPAMMLTYKDDQLHGETTIFSHTGAVIIRGDYESGSPKNGLFISDPYEYLRTLTTHSKTFSTTLLRYEDGQHLDSKPIIVETGP
jgi:hypothetical protein